MKKTDLIPGELLAYQRSKYDRAVRVYLLDDEVWKATKPLGNRNPHTYESAPGRRPYEGKWGAPVFGYPVLAFYEYAYNRLDVKGKAAVEALLTGDLVTMDSLLDTSGALRTGSVPSGLQLLIVNPAHLRGFWGEYQAAEEAAQQTDEKSQTEREQEHALVWERFNVMRQRVQGSGVIVFDVKTRTVTMPLWEFERIAQAADFV